MADEDTARRERYRDDEQQFDKLRADVQNGSDYWPPGSWPRYVLALLRRIEALEQKTK